MNAAQKANNNPEGYGPGEKPELIQVFEQKAATPYQTYKTIEYRMDDVEYPDSFKMAGVPYSLYPDFANIGRFHDEYKALMMDRYAPYTEVGISRSFGESYDYLFGCQVESLDELPEGLIGIDTGLKRFASITFRAPSQEELVGGSDGPGDAMVIATEFLKEVWLPEHLDEVAPIVDWDSSCFEIKIGEETYHMNLIEVYKVELDVDAEMCYYIPLKP
ncbi:hypothetical protein [Gorillibacterium timonense]|uniref:hypothetical protein n=1 Tax=Gorillibacterium timonense TaxID=1689269 RepID=UPI00071D7582|nr:hypothetical protein [Gorillibacterium timonense]